MMDMYDAALGDNEFGVTMEDITSLSLLNDDLRETILRVERRLRRVYELTGRSLRSTKEARKSGEEPVNEMHRKAW
jgi:hypothetical protein